MPWCERGGKMFQVRVEAGKRYEKGEVRIAKRLF
jgi:hypothetical protein